MERIHILPPEIISRIAAGEVIERPASAVKELIENSLDACADSIQVHLEKAGTKLIRIRDNGSGISGDDLPQVFTRHATSKLSSLKDLEAISSLGFRGEALYSIAAIADVTLRSKTADAQTGWEIHVRAGEVISLKPIPFTRGTEIEINEIFFNTPARRKFLKSDTAELKQIIDILLPYALLHPQARFELTHAERSIISLTPDTSRKSRAAYALKLNPKHILESSLDLPEMGLKSLLLLGDINIQRSRRDMQYIAVNNRPVQNRSISFQLNEAFRSILPEGIHPFFCVFITIPPSDVDVNVHPAKREVKIKGEPEIASSLRRAVQQTLMQYSAAKQANEHIFTLNSRQDERIPLFARTPAEIQQPSSAPLDAQQHRLLFDDSSSIPLYSAERSLKNMLANARFIGTFRDKYLLFDSRDSLLLIDQHAAHERINYEKFRNQIDRSGIEIDSLITPILLKVNSQEMLLWEELKDKLEKVGFSTTSWDTETVALHAYPRLIRDPQTALRMLLAEQEIARADTDTLARRACHASVAAGEDIKPEEALNIKKELLLCETPFTCPHGRPTVIEIKEAHISKQFLR